MQSVRSDRMIYLGVVAPLVLAVAALLALCILGFGVLSAARAYVGGESLWSKARASAVAQLRAHVQTGNDADYRRFKEALAVPLGDRAARLELDKVRPDMRVVEQGFLAGENAPEDIPGLIRLYRYFRHVDFMEEAVSAWTEGDRLIEELQALGLRIHLHVQRGDPPATLALLLADLDVLDGRLVNVEKYFSATLGRASRKTGEWLVVGTTTLAALLVLGGAWFVRRTLRQQLADRQLLIEANQRWELAADAAGFGLFDWRIGEDRFELDARAAALYGLGDGSAGARLHRRELRALTHPDDQGFARSRVDEAVARNGLLRTRYRIVTPQGELRHVESIGRVSEWHLPERAHMVGILRDVGAEVAQARLMLEKEAAERAARLRLEFLSRLSHELRTPLNAVLGVAQLLRIDPLEPLTESQNRRVQMLLDSGTQLLRLVEDVLDITRMDSGQMQIDNVPTDVLGAVRSALDIVEPERASFGVRVEDRMPHKTMAVKAEPQRLRQVFVNLLSNACKYNRPGGAVTLAYREDDRSVSVDIRDQGPGMTAQQVAALFEPFRRVTQAPQVSGSGLGLVVSKLLLEQMHGSVSVQSEPGQGSCFTVTLQRA
ncbi:MAG TPA: PAS domain-containing sensor histidine kinase [Albitalea sp.]|nr:PAS domain-containing sensor histidine kinase [Albitalea sp.]